MHRRPHPAPTVDAQSQIPPFLNIHSAAFAGNFGLVAYALNAGSVSPSANLDGLTPLHSACSGTNEGNAAVVRLLLERGTHVNAQVTASKHARKDSNNSNKIGWTPLHFAASLGRRNVVDILLANGADAHIVDAWGASAKDVANDENLIDILKDYMERNPSRSSQPHQPSTTGSNSATLLDRVVADREKGTTTSTKKLMMKKSLENSFLNKTRDKERDTPQGPFTATFGSFSHHQQQQSLHASPSSTYSFPFTDPYFYQSRRPSLPHTNSSGFFSSTTHSPGPAIPPSTSAPPTSRKGGKAKRPSSAGSGSTPQSPTSSSKKVTTKYSLLNLLRRSTDQDRTHPHPSMTDPSITSTAPPSQTTFFSSPPPPPPSKISTPPSFNHPLPPQPPQQHGDNSLPGSPTSLPMRPGILRGYPHGRSGSSSNSITSPNGNGSFSSGAGSYSSSYDQDGMGEVSRKASMRTLRFEESPQASSRALPVYHSPHHHHHPHTRQLSDTSTRSAGGEGDEERSTYRRRNHHSTNQKSLNHRRMGSSLSPSPMRPGTREFRPDGGDDLDPDGLPPDSVESPTTIEAAPDYSSDFSDEERVRSEENGDSDSDSTADSDSESNESEDDGQYAVYRDDEDEDDDDAETPGEIKFRQRSGSAPVHTRSPLSASSFTVRTHKDARNLVAQVQREILSGVDMDEPGDGTSGPNTGGMQMSLSDQLAKYGETLELERRLAREERWRDRLDSDTEEAEISVVDNGRSNGLKEDADERRAETMNSPSSHFQQQSPIVSRKVSVPNLPPLVLQKRTVKRSQSGGEALLKQSTDKKESEKKRRPEASRRPHTSNGVVRHEGGSAAGSPRTRMVPLTIPSSDNTSTIASYTTNGKLAKCSMTGIEIIKTCPTPTDSPGAGAEEFERPSEGNKKPTIIAQSYSDSKPLRSVVNPNTNNVGSGFGGVPLSRTASQPLTSYTGPPAPSIAVTPSYSITQGRYTPMSSTPKLARMGIPFDTSRPPEQLQKEKKEKGFGLSRLVRGIKGK